MTCQSDKHKQPETFNEDLSNTDLYKSNANGQSSDDENYQAGLDFLNSYIEKINSLEILEYVKTSPLATENLKTALENILIKAWEEDPELGLEFDPLFDAQDYPPRGVEMVDFNQEQVI